MSDERDLAEAIHQELISPDSVAAAVNRWNERAHVMSRQQRMRDVLAAISARALDAVLARRQSLPARTGPRPGPQEEPGYPGSLLPPKRRTP